MRHRTAAALAGAFLLAAATAAPAEPLRDCRRMTKQIAHFEGIVELAEERDNELWEAETRRHVERLELRRANRCPRYAEELAQRSRAARAAENTKKFLAAAGKVALRVFTFGAY